MKDQENAPGGQPVDVPPPPSPLPRTKTSGLAVTALILCLVPITIPIGVVVAVLAILRIRSRPDLSGTGLAVVGLKLAGAILSAAVLVVLISVVMTARQHVVGVLIYTQVDSLTNACNVYYTIFEAYPGVVANPPFTGGTPPRLSGAQNLRLSLLGCSHSAGTYKGEYQGPADDIDNYASEQIHKHEIYDPRPEALVPHTSVHGRDTGWDSLYGSIKVFVDFRCNPPRPLLYYRALPRQVDTDYFQFDDNAVYCDPDKGETEAKFKAEVVQRAVKAHGGFIIISAGPDRVFFTEDDYSNVAD